MSSLITQAANRYVVWNGEPKQFEMWKKKFMVNCRSRGVCNGFTMEEEDYPTPPDTKDDEEEMKRYKEEREKFEDNNNKSFEHLVNSIDHNKDKGTQALNYVFGARTARFPEGSARLAMERLNNRYDVKDLQDQEELQIKFDKAMLNRENPSDFEQDLREIKRKLEDHYDIKKTDKEYTQKLINCVNEKAYELDKRC